MAVLLFDPQHLYWLLPDVINTIEECDCFISVKGFSFSKDSLWWSVTNTYHMCHMLWVQKLIYRNPSCFLFLLIKHSKKQKRCTNSILTNTFQKDRHFSYFGSPYWKLFVGKTSKLQSVKIPHCKCFSQKQFISSGIFILWVKRLDDYILVRRRVLSLTGRIVAPAA